MAKRWIPSRGSRSFHHSIRPLRAGLRIRTHRRHPRVERLEARLVMEAAPLISELLASNNSGLEDADGDSSDWIEFYNPNAEPLDLEGWALTDDPGDLNQWLFPSLTIAGNDFLTVFASGKDRAVAGEELHTNFQLSADGEYLALVRPDGIVAREFNPGFPPQASNVSYGPVFDTHELIVLGDTAQYLVPASDALGDSWTTTSFEPSDWAGGATGLGFGVLQAGFSVTYIQANTYVDDLDVARNVVANPSLQRATVAATAPVINYLGTGGSANFGDDLPFPTQEIGEDYDDFVVHATATIAIPSAGQWSFGVNSDDGFELTLERDGVVFHTEYFSPRGPGDTIAVFDIPTAGAWDATLLMYERGGGAEVELFAAQGSHPTFTDATFVLVGDRDHGGLTAYSAVSDVVATDLTDEMRGINSSVYVRVPFTMTDATAYESLTLSMRYDDGFVAYLNGVEVARRNAPDTLTYHASATVDRDDLASQTPETIQLGQALGLLQEGTNVLALQGLNASAADSSFLVLPELTASRVRLDELRYFAEPTPGAPNSAPSLGIVQRVTASQEGGFYLASFPVSLATSTAGAEIRYTLDGSAPTATNGAVYSAPLVISGTTSLRACAFQPDYIALPSITRTYVFPADVVEQSSDGSPPAGWPSSWGNNVVDYGMDPAVVHGVEIPQSVIDALLAIPSVAITTDLENLFDPSTGIYANAYYDGRDWERPASFELLNPDGSQGFQVNAGLRIRGGYSRSGGNPKHAFRLFFRGEYGDSSLDFPLFGDEGATSFKKLDLRTAQNYSWSFGGDPSNTFIEDVFARETLRDMGQPYTRSRWYHLYINGQYWGLYQSQERPEAEYAASYFGGSAADYDVIKPEAGPYIITATDGNLDAYRRLWDSAVVGFADDAAYWRLQGKNRDGSENLSYEVLLDTDNLITYMINILYGGNLDAPISNFLGNERVNNFFAIRDRTSRQGFRYFVHDSEHTLRNLNEDRNGPYPAGSQFEYFNPQWLHQQLMANAEYCLRFADAVQQAFYNGGALTVEQAQARWSYHMEQLDQAIIAESARWGDAQRPDSPLGRADWRAAAANTRNNYLPNRGSIVLQQFRGNGLLPTFDAPQYLLDGAPSQGGQIAAGSTLRFAAGGGLVYFTTDGTDPRLLGGGINPTAQAYDPAASTETLVPAGATWKYFDGGSTPAGDWPSSTWDDAAWSSGAAELGYGDGDEATVVSYGPDAGNKYITTYFRHHFTVADGDGLVGLTLQLKRDDGAVVYVNGAEAARSNMPTGDISFSTPSASIVGGTDESTFFELVLDPSLLQVGDNVIAVEIHQCNSGSSDVSFDAVLAADRQINPGLILDSSTRFISRVRSDEGDWSARNEAEFLVAVPAAAGNLTVSELMYHPPAASGSEPSVDEEEFEFIELRNTGDETINLSGVRFTDGIGFDFSDGDVSWLDPGACVVVVRNQAAFEARYGTGINIAGSYQTSSSNNFSNGGELVTIVDAADAVIQSFRYDDDPSTTPPWPPSADGEGYSLTIRRTGLDYSLPGSWRASYLLHGTPGYIDVIDTWSTVVGRHIFYNRSAWDGNGAAADAADDSAIAPDKQALLSGQKATFANYTSYSRGINGIMIDIAHLADSASLSVADFEFRTGNTSAPAGWSLLAIDPSLITVAVRPGAGTDGSDRVTILLPDGAVKKTWLQVTVKATDATELATPDVHYWGNAVGDSGDSTGNTAVNVVDALGVRANPHTLLKPAPIEDAYDYNRDTQVNVQDELIVRANPTTLLTDLNLIDLTGSGGGEGEGEGEVVGWWLVVGGVAEEEGSRASELLPVSSLLSPLYSLAQPVPLLNQSVLQGDAFHADAAFDRRPQSLLSSATGKGSRESGVGSRGSEPFPVSSLLSPFYSLPPACCLQPDSQRNTPHADTAFDRSAKNHVRSEAGEELNSHDLALAELLAEWDQL